MTQAANDQVLRALEFLDRAQQYRTTYKQTPNLNCPPEWPKYSLLYLAVELVLKAYLLQQGISRKTLASKKSGHDTKLRVDEAVRLGLTLPVGTQDMIAGLSEPPPADSETLPTHIKMRYPPDAPVFSLGQFEPHMDHLFEAIGPLVPTKV